MIGVRTPESRVNEHGMKRKKTYCFSVVLTTSALSEENCDALYEAGCDDGTIVNATGSLS